MSSVIQIKNGPGKPEDGVLLPYELGISNDNFELYAGAINEEQVVITKDITVGHSNNADIAEKMQILTAFPEDFEDNFSNWKQFGHGIFYFSLEGEQPSFLPSRSGFLINNIKNLDEEEEISQIWESQDESSGLCKIYNRKILSDESSPAFTSLEEEKIYISVQGKDHRIPFPTQEENSSGFSTIKLGIFLAGKSSYFELEGDSNDFSGGIKIHKNGPAIISASLYLVCNPEYNSGIYLYLLRNKGQSNEENIEIASSFRKGLNAGVVTTGMVIKELQEGDIIYVKSRVYNKDTNQGTDQGTFPSNSASHLDIAFL